MTDYDSIYNNVVRVNESEVYLVQDGPLMDEPLIRDVKCLLECERDNLQVLLGEKEK